jgi:hypothetical protein
LKVEDLYMKDGISPRASVSTAVPVFLFLLLSASVFIHCSKSTQNSAPVISDVVAPDSLIAGYLGGFFAVSVSDPQGLGDVAWAYLQVSAPNSNWNPGILYLRDDGTSGDSTAGDGTYSLLISAPPDTTNPGEYDFTFKAKDNDGAESNQIVEKVRIVGNDAPQLSNLVAPDSLEAGEDSAFFSVMVSDPQGQVDIASVYLDIEHPTSPWNPDTASLFDDGSHGDATPGDGVYSLLMEPPPEYALNGNYNYIFRARDIKGKLSASLTKAVKIIGNRAPVLSNIIAPDSLFSSGDSGFFSVEVYDPDGGAIEAVFIDIDSPLSIWSPDSVPLYDDGSHGDLTSGDGVFSLMMPPPPDSALTGSYTFNFKAVDDLQAVGELEVQVDIIGNYPPTLSNLQAPDTLERTNDTTDTWLASVLAEDDQGLSGIDKVWFYVIKPDSSLGNTFDMYDDGTHGDEISGNGYYSLRMQKPSLDNQTGDYRFIFKAKDIYQAISDSLLHYIHVK